MGLAFRVLLLLFFGHYLYAFSYFMAVEEPWLISILNANREIWTRDGISTEFSIADKKKLLVAVNLPSRIYDHDRNWRSSVIAYLNFLQPLLAKRVESYASQSFLKAFNADFDIIWQIYIGTALYGEGEGREIRWKKGIY